MFKVGDKAYFSEDTLRRVRGEGWRGLREQEMHWSPYGLTNEMVVKIMKHDYIVVESVNENKNLWFKSNGYAWANSWFKEPVPKGLEGATKLV